MMKEIEEYGKSLYRPLKKSGFTVIIMIDTLFLYNYFSF
jgi:hypothetical protein